MALVTTAGSSTADAYVSVEDATTYHAARGHDAWVTDGYQATHEAAIRRATAWLSVSFSWKGYRTNGRDQALAWPRTDVLDAEDEEVDSDAIPTEIVHACCEAALYELQNPGGLTPNVTLTERVKSERVGPIAVEYATMPNSPELARPTLTLVRDLVSGLVSGSGNALVGTAVRG